MTAFRHPVLLASTATLTVGLLLGCGGLELPLGETPEEEPEVVETPPEPAAPRFYYVPGAEGLGDAGFSPWQAGDRVFIGVDETNLRAGPVVGDNVVEKLDLGVEVEVVNPAGDAIVLIGRRNSWYQIRTRTGVEGYVFGSVLSPIRVSLDGESGEEPYVGVVTFSQEFGPRLRMWQPPNGQVYALDALPTRTFATGGTIQARTEGRNVVVELCDPATNRCAEATFGFADGDLLQLSPDPETN